MAGANLKAVQVRDDTDRGRGHAIIELIGSQLPEQDWTFAIRRRGFEESNLGPDGWQAAEHRLTPDAAQPAQRGVELRVGPDVVGYMTAGNYEISFAAPGLAAPLSAVLPWRNIAPAPMRKGPRRAQLVEQPALTAPQASPISITAEKVQVFIGRPESADTQAADEQRIEPTPPGGEDAVSNDTDEADETAKDGSSSKLADEEAARAAAALAAEQERLRRKRQAMRVRIASLAAAILLLIAGGGTYFYCCGPEPVPEEKPKDSAQDKEADKSNDGKPEADKKSDTADSGAAEKSDTDSKKEQPSPSRSPQDEATSFLAANPTPDQIFAKAEAFRQAGNVDVAMVLLRRPADSGHAASARALGQIYDPAELSPGRRAQRKDGNLAFAHSWYSRAAKAGSAEARTDLDRLRAVAEAAAKRGDSAAAGLLQRW